MSHGRPSAAPGADYLARLARLAHRVRVDDLAPAAVDAARNVVLDTLGAILAGSRLPENARLADLAVERSGMRTATVIGRARKADPMLATLANGTAGVSLEVDEGNRWGGGHPAIHVLPAALAVAEEIGTDGGRLIEALVAATRSPRALAVPPARVRTCTRTGRGGPPGPRWPWRSYAGTRRARSAPSSTSPPR